MTLALFVTLGMLAVERYLARGRLPLAGLAGAAFGLAALTKGPVGFLLPGTALALYAALARRPDLFRPRALLAGLAGASLTAAPWYAYVFLTHRELLTGAFLGQGNVWRFLNPEHRSFPLYYAFVLVAGLLPWSGALPAAIAEAARPSGWARERGRGREAGPLFALCWFVAVVAVFEVTASKLPTYVLPAFAPAATLIGGYWDRALGAGGLSRPSWHARLSAALGVVAALLAGAMIVGSLHERDWVDARGSGAGFAALLIVVAVVGLAAVLRGSLPALVASQAAGAALAMLVVVAWALPRLEETRSARPMVLDLERRGVAAELAGMAAIEDWYGFDFYLGRPLPRISAADLPRAVLEHPGRIWLVHTDQRDRLLAGAGLSATAVISGPLLTALRLEPAAPRDGGER
jgi:4-amino-4-deoxy-L-arabinose transferase-like glycosyltransferase